MSEQLTTDQKVVLFCKHFNDLKKELNSIMSEISFFDVDFDDLNHMKHIFQKLNV
jgi:glutamate racemase